VFSFFVKELFFQELGLNSPFPSRLIENERIWGLVVKVKMDILMCCERRGLGDVNGEWDGMSG